MTLEVIKSYGDDILAKVFVARTKDGSLIEFVESVQPPKKREEKWVLIISTLKGCPIKCPICDAGGNYQGKLTTEEILAQVEYLIKRRYPNYCVPAAMTKIQFARMGDPALNKNVLEALRLLPSTFKIASLHPSISTVAPKNCIPFLQELKEIKDTFYSNGNFQMQFSVHTTCDQGRKKLIPAATLNLEQIARQGDLFFSYEDRKITLNFAATKDFPLEAKLISKYFDPEKFIIKLTPINPTNNARESKLYGTITPENKMVSNQLCSEFKTQGFDVILSIGEVRENQIGSNCGMFVAATNKETQHKKKVANFR